MEKDAALPPWLIFLLIALGIALAVGVALLMTQLDTLQQRALLPQPTLPVVDPEATLASGDLTVVVIVSEDAQSGTPTLAPMSTSQTPEAGTVELTAPPVLIPTCAAAPEDWTPYSVQEGETLTTLSIELGVGLDLLVQANCLTRLQLIPGQIIRLPQLAPTREAEEACGAPNGWVQYAIRPGDTLASLAKTRDTTVVEIMQANCLEGLDLVPGRKIFLPPMPAQNPMPPPGMPLPPAHQAPPRWPSAVRPSATHQTWPTMMASSTATKMPWPEATSTPVPSATSTAVTFVTVSPTLKETAAPPPNNTPEIPLPTATPEVPYPANVPSPTATTTRTPLPSATATPTPSPTATASSTPSPTPTATFMASPSATASTAPSSTPTATFTPSPTSTDPPAASTATMTPLPYPYP